MFIPYGKQLIEEDDINAVCEVLKSDFLTTGPMVETFEKEFAKYVGSKYAVAVNSGTAALHISCLAAGISQGDQVITSSITFAASSNSVLYCGGEPIFSDIDLETLNIDTKDIEQKITKKTKAIIPVHMTGNPCEMGEITRIARKNDLIVIEDASHALGAEYKGQKIGSISDMTVFSFHPVKHITTGEGGMVTTNDEELYNKLKLFRTHGITRDSGLMSKSDGQWYYEQLELGYNYRISDIQCALGLSQLKKIDRFVNRRREIASIYYEAFGNNHNLILPKEMNDSKNSYHLYVLQLKNHNRKEVFDKLRNVGLGVNVHYVPVYKHPYYQKNGYMGIECVNSECYYERAISIPIYPLMNNEEVNYVVEKINEIIK